MASGSWALRGMPGNDQYAEARAANGAGGNRLDAALTRLDEVEESQLRQLTETESAVESSLMDFLR